MSRFVTFTPDQIDHGSHIPFDEASLRQNIFARIPHDQHATPGLAEKISEYIATIRKCYIDGRGGSWSLAEPMLLSRIIQIPLPQQTAQQKAQEEAQRQAAIRAAQLSAQQEAARQQAENQRQAAIRAQQAEAARQAEIRRQAQLAAQREAARVAEQQRQAAIQLAARQAEAERQAAIQLAAQQEAVRRAEALRVQQAQEAARIAEAARVAEVQRLAQVEILQQQERNRAALFQGAPQRLPQDVAANAGLGARDEAALLNAFDQLNRV